MFHQDAFREILLNAVVHKDYSACNPIQISVYEDKIYIWNDGEMPEYNINKLEDMVLCKACDRCLELLLSGGNNSLI